MSDASPDRALLALVETAHGLMLLPAGSLLALIEAVDEVDEVLGHGLLAQSERGIEVPQAAAEFGLNRGAQARNVTVVVLLGIGIPVIVGEKAGHAEKRLHSQSGSRGRRRPVAMSVQRPGEGRVPDRGVPPRLVDPNPAGRGAFPVVAFRAVGGGRRPRGGD